MCSRSIKLEPKIATDECELPRSRLLPNSSVAEVEAASVAVVKHKLVEGEADGYMARVGEQR